MTADDVKTTFRAYVKGGSLYISSAVFVDIEDFCNVFADVESISYDALIAADGGEKGYAEFFTRCRDQGVLN